jgi:exodeoxyribonuclease V beta subunit
LHQKEVENKWSKDALLDWLLSEMEGGKKEDVYTKRIESDEDAVKIVTIHKSKGLAYNIVFLPHLDIKPKNNKIITFKNELKETCVSMYKSEKEIQSYNLQSEQENRRLIYVAVTRAVYACYIYQNTKSKGSISPFIEQNTANDFIVKTNTLLPKPIDKYKYQKNKQTKKARVFKGKIKKYWEGNSFSGISQEHISFSAESQIDYKNNYDQFIFEHLPKGAVIGNFLHEILENADFTSNNFKELIFSVSNRYTSVYQPSDLEFYQTWIKQVLEARLQELPFTLSDISTEKKIAEMPFFFKKKKIKAEEINSLSPFIHVENDINAGAMGGFIDLFFEHQGKYYLLDWKSNFLGNKKEDYNQENMELSMKGNNYHLQYLIYTIAIKRYLEHKGINFEKTFGGVLYIFLRGCRIGESYGIYYQKPNDNLIKKLDDLF